MRRLSSPTRRGTEIWNSRSYIFDVCPQPPINLQCSVEKSILVSG